MGQAYTLLFGTAPEDPPDTATSTRAEVIDEENVLPEAGEEGEEGEEGPVA